MATENPAEGPQEAGKRLREAINFFGRQMGKVAKRAMARMEKALAQLKKQPPAGKSKSPDSR